ncbi:hypothetical protein D3C81_838360 [compost metagenome]
MASLSAARQAATAPRLSRAHWPLAIQQVRITGSATPSMGLPRVRTPTFIDAEA